MLAPGPVLRVPPLRQFLAPVHPLPVPMTVAGLRLWLDAAVGTFQDSGFSTPAAVNNDPVGGWRDQGTFGYHATQGTAGARPLLKTAVFGSLPGILFDGSDDVMAADGAAAFASGEDQPFTILAVLKLEAVPAGSRTSWSFGGSGGLNQRHWGGHNATPVWSSDRRDDTAAGGAAASALAPDTTPHVVTWAFSGTAISAWVDQANILNEAAQNVGACTFDRFSLGCLRRSNEVQHQNLHIGAVLAYAGALSAPDRETVEDYLAARFGIAFP